MIRDGFEEISVDGELAICDGRGVVYATHGESGRYPARSLLKPFQFLSAQVPAERWSGGKDLRYTPCLGSLSATEDQARQIERWYEPERLARLLPFNRVPASYPMDDRHRVLLKGKGMGPKQLFHTCFSKHMGILEGCEARGWDLESYLDVKHPFNAALAETIRSLLPPRDEMVYVTDGCGLPSPVLRLSELALLYQRLASAPAHGTLGGIRQMMLTHPEWIGGPGRVDTSLMEKNPALVVSKEGADGLLALAVLPTDRFPTGLGIVVKIASGYYPPLAALALAPVLERLGLQPVHHVPRGQQMRSDLKGLLL